MEIETILLSLLVYIGCFFLLKSVYIKRNSSFKRKIIFSYLFFTFVLGVTVLSFINEQDKVIWNDVIIITNFLICINLSLYFDYKKKEKKTDKVKENDVFKLTYLKGVKRLSIITPIIFVFY